MNGRFNYTLFITIVVIFAVLGSYLFIAPASSSATRETLDHGEATSVEYIRVSD